ncbi:MAG: efflux RND transporter periplasmic adaptor subunit [Phycisphaerae bacterium]|nr:efflux RND transporter periplasmic adaptor subunit [Phycisphaerae bacterium]
MDVYSTGGSKVRTFSGVAQAGIESKLSFKVPGTVKNVYVEVGDQIQKGELLAELDATDYQLQVQQAEASLTQARAQARNAQANFERIRTLYESNNVSKSNYDAARSAKESAQAAVRAAEKQLELAKQQLSYTRLTAPIAGAIAMVNVEENENVVAGQPVVLLTAGSDIEVKLTVPEVLISRMKEGKEVTVTFDALPSQEFPAAVTEVGVTATGTGTAYPVTVRLRKKDEAIRPGMAANVTYRFESSDERERFMVPSHAVMEDRKGRFVYVVKPIPDEPGLGIIQRRPVTIGELTADGIEIFEGLSDGDMVVTAGVSRITEGQKVRI